MSRKSKTLAGILVAVVLIVVGVLVVFLLKGKSELTDVRTSLEAAQQDAALLQEQSEADAARIEELTTQVETMTAQTEVDAQTIAGLEEQSLVDTQRIAELEEQTNALIAAESGNVDAELADALAQLEEAKEALALQEVELEKAKAALAEKEGGVEAAREVMDTAGTTAELEKAQADLAAAQEELETVRADLETAQADLETAQTQLAEKEEALTAAQTEIEDLQTQVAAYEEGITEAQTQLAEKEEALTAAQTEIEDLQAQVAAYEEGITEAQTQLAADQDTLQADREALTSKQDVFTQKKAELTRFVETRQAIPQQFSAVMADMGITDAKVNEDGSVVFTGNATFASNDCILTDASCRFLSNFIPAYVRVMMQEENQQYLAGITIEGHADNVGDYAHNMYLSQQRAYSVFTYIMNDTSSGLTQEERDWLVERMTVSGVSSSDPVYDEDGNYDAKASRRVVIRFRMDSEKQLEEVAGLLEEMTE